MFNILVVVCNGMGYVFVLVFLLLKRRNNIMKMHVLIIKSNPLKNIFRIFIMRILTVKEVQNLNRYHSLELSDGVSFGGVLTVISP